MKIIIWIHFHENNCCGVRIHNGVTVPNVFECTFLNKKYFTSYPELNIERIQSILDMKNVINGEEIYINHPPFAFLK